MFRRIAFWGNIAENKISMKNPKTPQVFTKPKTIILLIILILLLILIPLYIYLDIQSRNAFNILQNDMNKIEQTTIIPAGGLLQNSKSLGINALQRLTTCYLMTCPSISTSWVVPIEAGGDEVFIKRLLEKSSYTDINGECVQKEQLCGYSAANLNHSKAEVHTKPAGNYDKIPTTQDIGKKVWRNISVTLTTN